MIKHELKNPKKKVSSRFIIFGNLFQANFLRDRATKRNEQVHEKCKILESKEPRQPYKRIPFFANISIHIFEEFHILLVLKQYESKRKK